MAHYSPELIERFIRDRDQRRKVIAAGEGLDHPLVQKLSEIASLNFEWVEHNASANPHDDTREWIVAYVETQQKIEAINWLIGSMRVIENAAGEDNSQSNWFFQELFFSSFPDYSQTWRKTELNAYWKARAAFEAVYSVWAAEWGVKGSEVYAVERSSVVPDLVHSKRRATNTRWRNPTGLLDIYAYVGAQNHQSRATVRRLVDRFCKMAPRMVLANLETGQMQRDEIISDWRTFMKHQKS